MTPFWRSHETCLVMEYIMLDALEVKVTPPIQFLVMTSFWMSHETYRVKEYVMMDALRVRATPHVAWWNTCNDGCLGGLSNTPICHLNFRLLIFATHPSTWQPRLINHQKYLNCWCVGKEVHIESSQTKSDMRRWNLMVQQILATDIQKNVFLNSVLN